MFMMTYNCCLASVRLQFKELILQIQKQFHLELAPHTMIYLSEARGIIVARREGPAFHKNNMVNPVLLVLLLH